MANFSRPELAFFDRRNLANFTRREHWHTKHPYLGSRKIVVELQQEGYHICRKTVRRLMGDMGIHAVYPKVNLSKRNFKEAVVPYLLRNYKAEFPNQVWSIDITYIPMKRSHMYLTALIDWCSRKIVGTYLSDTLDTTSVIRAVREAVTTHGLPVILNSFRPGKPVHQRRVQAAPLQPAYSPEHGRQEPLGGQHHD
ncbi:MAG: IS3 family transposase [Selenomonadaceae bacterium]|nr:IS3 family transposase [Selenomonadaceae bacterium]